MITYVSTHVIGCWVGCRNLAGVCGHCFCCIRQILTVPCQRVMDGKWKWRLLQQHVTRAAINIAPQLDSRSGCAPVFIVSSPR